MDLLFERYYPDYDTYVGEAGRIEVEFTAISLFQPIQDVVNWIVSTAIESVVNPYDNKLLLVRIWTEPAFHKYIPITKWVIEVNATSTTQASLAKEVNAELLTIAVLAGLIIAGLIAGTLFLRYGASPSLKSATSFFHGHEPEPWQDPGGMGERQPTPFESIAKTMQWSVIGLVSIGAMLTIPRMMEMYKEYKPPQTVYQIE